MRLQMGDLNNSKIRSEAHAPKSEGECPLLEPVKYSNIHLKTVQRVKIMPLTVVNGDVGRVAEYGERGGGRHE